MKGAVATVARKDRIGAWSYDYFASDAVIDRDLGAVIEDADHAVLAVVDDELLPIDLAGRAHDRLIREAHCRVHPLLLRGHRHRSAGVPSVASGPTLLLSLCVPRSVQRDCPDDRGEPRERNASSARVYIAHVSARVLPRARGTRQYKYNTVDKLQVVLEHWRYCQLLVAACLRNSNRLTYSPRIRRVCSRNSEILGGPTGYE